MRLVNIKIPASTSNTIATEPLITFVYQRIATATAMRMRMTRSAEPIFFFITFYLMMNTIAETIPAHITQTIISFAHMGKCFIAQLKFYS